LFDASVVVMSVSSQDSQLLWSVAPPAQLRTVPLNVGHAAIHFARCVSKIRFVLPPAAAGE
jgi:hypothetical protein